MQFTAAVSDVRQTGQQRAQPEIRPGGRVPRALLLTFCPRPATNAAKDLDRRGG
jgi:hypothetical protein